MEKFKIGLVSLGCDKNRVDSEIILANLNNSCEIVNDPKIADVIIVNTCGFIEASKQESIDTILEMANYKEKYNCKILVVTGCLSQRYGKELLELMPEIDILLGTNDYTRLNEYIEQYMKDHNKIYMCNYSDKIINEGERILSTPKYSAYIRIAEGCDNFCTYCIIPKIRGKFRSRPMENILREAKSLAIQGVKEIILIAQDTTMYGKDIYGSSKTHELVKSMAEIEGIKWIRLLYCYPEEITEELINEMATNIKVCKYLDIPIQHISDNVLKRMGRRSSKAEITSIINKLRERIPNITLRTSIIVGFPGETEEDINILKDFLIENKLDNVGVFKYSQEEGTPAALMGDQIEEDVKEKRRSEVMLLQKSIMERKNKNKLNKVYQVLVENFDGQYYIGRNCEMSPEIDGAIYFKCDKMLSVGDIISVRIIDIHDYDLIGVV